MDAVKKDQWNAQDYAKNSGAQEAWARELMTKLELKGNERALDIGCGDGRITQLISSRLKQGSIVGIDYSTDMVNLARNSHQADNLEFEVMDATNIAFEERFDLAFSNAALHWVKDHRKVLKTLAANLNPNARVLLQMGGKGNAAEILTAIDQVLSAPFWNQYFTDFEFPYFFYSDEDYLLWLNAAGLQGNRVELIPKDMMHDSPEQLKGWLRTTWFPYTNRVPESLREDFLSAIISNFLKLKPVDSTGRTHVNMVRLEVEATWQSAKLLG